jgi:hypothetical protein
MHPIRECPKNYGLVISVLIQVAEGTELTVNKNDNSTTVAN